MGSTIYQFLSEMIAFASVLLFLWAGFQLVSYIWVSSAQINRRIKMRARLAEEEAHDRRIWGCV